MHYQLSLSNNSNNKQHSIENNKLYNFSNSF